MGILVRRIVPAALIAIAAAGPCMAGGESGKLLLERSCGRCHAVTLDTKSPIEAAPNLRIVLESYTAERLEFELAEGIGSKHKDMPQVQFKPDEIRDIEDYLADR